jgi:hypothetical protein
MRWKGIDVFHTYKNDEWEDRSSYWYETSNSGELDVREIAKRVGITDLGDHRLILRKAINFGIIALNGINK